MIVDIFPFCFSQQCKVLSLCSCDRINTFPHERWTNGISLSLPPPFCSIFSHIVHIFTHLAWSSGKSVDLETDGLGFESCLLPAIMLSSHLAFPLFYLGKGANNTFSRGLSEKNMYKMTETSAQNTAGS